MSDSITITATVTELSEGGDGKPNFGVSVKNNSEGNYVGSIADTLARILFALSKQAADYVGSSDLRAAWEVLKEEVSEQVEEEIERTEARRIPLSTLDALSTLDVLQVLGGEPAENQDEDSESLIPEIGESVEELTAEIVSALPLGARFIDSDHEIWTKVDGGMRMENETERWNYVRFYGPYLRIRDLQED